MLVEVHHASRSLQCWESEKPFQHSAQETNKQITFFLQMHTKFHPEISGSPFFILSWETSVTELIAESCKSRQSAWKKRYPGREVVERLAGKLKTWLIPTYLWIIQSRRGVGAGGRLAFQTVPQAPAFATHSASAEERTLSLFQTREKSSSGQLDSAGVTTRTYHRNPFPDTEFTAEGILLPPRPLLSFWQSVNKDSTVSSSQWCHLGLCP